MFVGLFPCLKLLVVDLNLDLLAEIDKSYYGFPTYCWDGTIDFDAEIGYECEGLTPHEE